MDHTTVSPLTLDTVSHLCHSHNDNCPIISPFYTNSGGKARLFLAIAACNWHNWSNYFESRIAAESDPHLRIQIEYYKFLHHPDVQ